MIGVPMSALSHHASLSQAINLQRRGKLLDAISLYKQVLSANPSHAEALHYLGAAYMQLGDFPEAERFLTRALRIAPLRINTQCDLATLRVRQSRFKEAVRLFDGVLKVDPNHPDALNNIASVWEQAHSPQDALPHLKRLTLIRPLSSSAFQRLGAAQYATGDVAAAIDNFRRAMDLDPDDKVVHICLGDAYESQGQFKQARMHYAAVLRRDMDSPHALAAMLQFREGEVPQEWVAHARALAERGEVDQDAKIRLYVALAHYYDRLHAYDMAFELLHRGNELQFAKDPHDSDRFTKAIDVLIETFTAEFFAQRGRAARKTADARFSSSACPVRGRR